MKKKLNYLQKVFLMLPNVDNSDLLTILDKDITIEAVSSIPDYSLIGLNNN